LDTNSFNKVVNPGEAGMHAAGISFQEWYEARLFPLIVCFFYVFVDTMRF
jgi:hypothetical protein